MTAIDGVFRPEEKFAHPQGETYKPFLQRIKDFLLPRWARNGVLVLPHQKKKNGFF
jgi:hypothetical protein